METKNFFEGVHGEMKLVRELWNGVYWNSVTTTNSSWQTCMFLKKDKKENNLSCRWMLNRK